MRNFGKGRFALAFATIASSLTLACTQMYLPDFDGGLLNPDIRILRAGEIMEGVKCAMVAFMHERELMLLKEREKYPDDLIAIEVGKDVEKFSPYEINVPADAPPFYKKRKRVCELNTHFAKIGSAGACVPNRCDNVLLHRLDDQRLGISIWDHKMKKDNSGPNGCTSVPDYSRFALDPTQQSTIQLTLTALNTGGMNYTRLDPTRLPLYPAVVTPGDLAKGFPFPSAMFSAKGTTIFEMNAIMPQSIHTYQQTASPQSFGYVEPKNPPFQRLVEPEFPEILLNAVPSLKQKVDDAFAKIGRARLQAEPFKEKGSVDRYLKDLQGWKVEIEQEMLKLPPDRPSVEKLIAKINERIEKAQDEIKAMVEADRKTTDEIRAILQGWLQAVLAWEIKSEAEKKPADIKALEEKIKMTAPALKNLLAQYNSSVTRKQNAEWIENNRKYFKDRLEMLLKAFAEHKQTNEFKGRCRVDTWTYEADQTRRVDFLALKRLLTNVVEEQDKAVYRGIPDVTLDKLVLTSAFQLTAEASAGTHQIFRIVPVLVPPTGSLKTDHTHQLKITLNGKKQKADKGNSKKLADSCHQRLNHGERKSGSKKDDQIDADAAAVASGKKPPANLCDTDLGQMLESIVQGLDKVGGAQ